jgi:hypothetical protein
MITNQRSYEYYLPCTYIARVPHPNHVSTRLSLLDVTDLQTSSDVYKLTKCLDM